MVIWPQSYNAPLTRKWVPDIKDSLLERGMNVTLDNVYLNYYLSGRTDRENARFIDSIVTQKVQDGSKPDLILVYGDEMVNDVCLTRSKAMHEIPLLYFGTYFPVQKGDRKNMTGFRDTLQLKENLDFIYNITGRKKQMILTQLDFGSSFVDDKLHRDLDEEMSKLDTTKYFNLMMLDKSKESIYQAKKQKKIIFLSLNLRYPTTNWTDMRTGEGFSVDYFFTDKVLQPNVIQVKYDPICYSSRMHSPAPCFFTTRAEHFSLADSCIGGYLVPLDQMLSDAMDYSSKILYDGIKPDQLTERMHSKKGYYVNWPTLRNRGWKREDIPSYVRLKRNGFKERHPAVVQLSNNLMVTMFVFVIIACALLAVRQTRRQARLMRDRSLQAKDFIEKQEILEMVMKHTKVSFLRINNETINVENSIRHSLLNQNYVTSIDELATKVEPFYVKKFIDTLHTEEEGTHTLQFQLRNSDGVSEWVNMLLQVKNTPKGIKRFGVLVNYDNIKRKEAEMIEAHRRMFNAQERDNFIHEMNHQIRTPLNSIVGFSQLLTMPDGFTEEEVKTFSNAIKTANEQILSIIENMLTLAHIRNSSLLLDMQPISMKTFTDEIRFNYEDKVKEAGMRLITMPVAEDFTFTADMRVMRMIMENLMSNAIKFNKPAGTIKYGWETDSDGKLSIYISDTGIGIAEDQLNLIFRRFYKVDSFKPGTGLGLSLVQELVQAMGYKLNVKSHFGIGTQFTITL